MSLSPPALQSVGEEGFSLSDDLTFSPLAQESQLAWYLCRYTTSSDTFIIATAASEDAIFQVTPLLKNEYALREKLSVSWAIRPLAHSLFHGRYALMYDVFSRRTLADFLSLTPQVLSDFLHSAILLCAPLSQMHQQGLVHGDIKPANFFINEDGTFRLGGFGLASVASTAPLPLGLPASGGTLAYMSPEHTTRTTQQVTPLSDLYSFGVVLYELLTGKLPFGTAEGGHAEWVHHHVASEPHPPHLVRTDVPAMLSSVILRLLEKSPAQRYQTVEGLLADLHRCRASLTPEGHIESFTPGLQDTQRKGFASGTLFNDHPQAENLLVLFDEVMQSGRSSLTVISGTAGSGKSSLLASGIRKLQQKKLLLTVVKADRHSPVLPYAVFTAAFRMVVLNLLGLSAEEVARWRSHLVRLLGDYVGLAINFVPELGVLLDQKAQPLADIHSLDARNRFTNMVCSLTKAFATPGRPLVMLIDDIHWADQASLQLLQNLLEMSEDIPLMLVVTHHDIASLPCPLIGMQLTALRSSTARSGEITPQQLSVKALAQWLADVFHDRPAATGELARLIHEKTGGNPLFTQEFFRQAVQDGIIHHGQYPQKWGYDRQALTACQYTENVANRVLQQLETVTAETRHLLGKVACLGGSGELMMLSKVLNLSVEALITCLLPAANAQLLTLTANHYAFTHDSVHEAAMDLNDPAEDDLLHLAAAQRFAELAAVDAGNDPLFRVVHHLATIKDLQLAQAEAESYRQLILMASRRAKNTGDYISSLRFLRTARALTPLVSNEDHFTFLLEEAECEFLQGNLAVALDLCGKLLALPGNMTDKAVAACWLAEIHMRQSDNTLALETAIAWLAVFGIHLNRHPDKAECDAARIALKAHVGINPYTRFRSLPLMASRENEAIMNLMASASMFAAFSSPRLHFMIVCKMLHLTLDHGMTGASTFALSWYGVLCGGHYDEYSRGYASTLLARELVYKHDFTSFKARTLMPLDQVSVWTMPMAYAIECAKETFNVAVANGDRTSACLALRHQTMNYLARGDHLEGVLTSIERALAYVRKAHYQDVESVLQMQREYVLFLRDGTQNEMSGNNFVPGVLQLAGKDIATQPLVLMQFWHWLYRGMAHFFSGEYADSERCLAQASRFIDLIPGHIHMLDFHLYSALSMTLQLEPATFTAAKQQKVWIHYEKIATWATENAKTFADKQALLMAEILRLEGKDSAAAEQYEEAIALSRSGQFEHMTGVAHEIAASFASARGLTVAAEAYLKGAINAWQRWGAEAKVRQLASRHAHLAPAGQNSPFTTVTFDQNNAVSDLQSVITAMRALTEEINLDRLINTLMMMLLERAGAQRCLLIRLLEGQIPEIEAMATSTAEGTRVKILQVTPTSTDLPLSVLSAVIRTGQEIRTGKPEIFSPFSQDPYLVASGAAVMCVPMFKQARMVGVLYLENRLMPDVFTAEHSRIVAILGAQAAISLETARLYSELLEENIQRRRVEKQLRSSQTSLMLGEKISHTGTWHWHLEQDMMLVSDEYRLILGLPEQQKSLSMANFLTRVHPDDRHCISELVSDSVRNGIIMQAEFRILRPDGECRYIKGIGEPVESWSEVKEYFGTISDITAQRLSEDAARLAQADLARVSRATTVGQLTSSIAHEINQPLMSIVANAGASLRWLKRDQIHLANACSSLEEIINEGKRAGDIIRGLQSLTRNTASEFAQANLHLIARDILSLSRMELERRWITLELKLRATNDAVYCDRVQIQQLLLNLVLNALEAMDETQGRAHVLTLSSWNPSPEVIRFEVSDTGTGLPEQVIKRIFDSFYTTKKEGMGMGLAISDEIIKKHRGELRAENRESGGSLFWFTLPTELEG
ncbi:AAA family ATPase [Erwinia sp.]|uniref:AAA family ATPase n=1 Tax=Erwinia citreus TaxID=558 RepID=UPI003C75BF45